MTERFPHIDIPADQEKVIRDAGAPLLNLYRILANNPGMLDAWLAFAYAIRANCTTPRALRELMILRTAQLHESQYEWEQHVRMALNAGVPLAQITQLHRWRLAPIYSYRERAALMLTEAIIENDVTDEVYRQVAHAFDVRELIELVMTASFYCMVPRVLDAIAVTSEGEENDECDRALRVMQSRVDAQ